MSDAAKIAVLERERATMLDMAARAHDHADYLRARRDNPLPSDDAAKLAADAECAERDEAQYRVRASEIESAIAAIHDATRQRRLEEARVIARALAVNVKDFDRTAKKLARCERSIIELRQRLADYESVHGIPARHLVQRGNSRDMALAAAGIATDSALSRGPIDKYSYQEQVLPTIARLLDDGAADTNSSIKE